MTDYRIEITDRAQQSIDAYAAHIEDQTGSIRVAHRWVQRIYDAVETLRYMPDRYDTAEDGIYCSYEVRRLLVGEYLVLYHVEEANRRVAVLNFRHGSKLPRVSDLPDDRSE